MVCIVCLWYFVIILTFFLLFSAEGHAWAILALWGTCVGNMCEYCPLIIKYYEEGSELLQRFVAIYETWISPTLICSQVERTPTRNPFDSFDELMCAVKGVLQNNFIYLATSIQDLLWRWNSVIRPKVHTGKCIRRLAGIRVLPVLHRPEVVDIGVNTI